jgi:putative transposase
MQLFYDHVGLTRQAHQQWFKRSNAWREVINQITTEVKHYRSKVDCRAGSRVLFYNLDIKERYDIGVNKFEQILSIEGLSLPVVRVKVVTTVSSKQSWNYKNRISGLVIDWINQVLVGDITYISHYGLRYYFFSEIDIYSGRIVGWSLSANMKAERAVEAFEMVLDCRGTANLDGMIQHTDGGGQYYSALFLDLVSSKGVIMSRAKTCLENGYAEQMNAYIKHHLMPLIKSRTLNGMRREMKKLIDQYNNDRKQERLGWLSPVEFEEELKMGVVKPPLSLHDFSMNDFRFSEA